MRRASCWFWRARLTFKRFSCSCSRGERTEPLTTNVPAGTSKACRGVRAKGREVALGNMNRQTSTLTCSERRWLRREKILFSLCKRWQARSRRFSRVVPARALKRPIFSAHRLVSTASAWTDAQTDGSARDAILFLPSTASYTLTMLTSGVLRVPRPTANIGDVLPHALLSKWKENTGRSWSHERVLCRAHAANTPLRPPPRQHASAGIQ